MSTLWNKGVNAAKIVEKFTVGDDNILDIKLAKYDVIGSKAHIKMLAKIGLLTNDEEIILQKELDLILKEIEAGDFVIKEDVEDIHSQIELLLTERVGDIGKKIHSGRSRNDQVLVDLKLFFKDELLSIKDSVINLFNQLQELSEKYKDILMPGYTHGQIAMPSSFGLWLGAYAETLIDDMYLLRGAYEVVNQNPLGSAAGYGNSFPLDRELTTELLDFKTLNYNSIAAQLSRGKTERSISFAISSISLTLNKFATDCCSYMSPNFGFISFPDDLTTGSSIMPHKKNPDVWEIIRGKSNMLQSIPFEISMLSTNLPHGYHRDYQLLKEILFPAFETIKDLIKMTGYMLNSIKINKTILDDQKYDYLFTVEEVNRLVLNGTPFREAYKIVGEQVNNGTFKSPKTIHNIKHTHLGSISNLATKEIKQKMDEAVRF